MPDTEALTQFFLHLNLAGYGLAPQQLAAAQHLLFIAHSEGWRLRRWQHAVRGTLAKTEAQIADFDRRFELWLGPGDEGRTPPPPQPRSTARTKWLIAGVAQAICALLAFSLLRNPEPEPSPAPEARVIPAPVPSAPPPTPVPRLPLPATHLPLLAAIPLGAFGIWLFVRWRRRSLWMSRGPELSLRDLELPDHDPATEGVFEQPVLERIAWSLRLPRAQPGQELDLAPTVAATAARAGAFTPVWRELTERTQYMFLIEEDGTHDHLARLFDQVVDSLRKSGVALERYYFHGDPRYLLTDDHTRSSAWLPSIADSRGRFPLVVVSSGQDFADPLSGAVDPRVAEALGLFRQRILLSTKPLESWSDAELMLLQAGFTVGTASTGGLLAAADSAVSGEKGAGTLLEGISLASGDDRRE